MNGIDWLMWGMLFGVCSAVAVVGRGRLAMVAADLALVNGRVWTVDRAQPRAEAVAVWNGRILAVGRRQDVEPLIGKDTEVIDLKNRLVVPGFIDSHTHFVDGGFWLTGVHLRDAKDEEEFGRRLAARSKELPADAWIVRGTWDHDNWPGGRLPTAELINRYVPDRPVFVTRYDGHMSVANSLALRMAGVTADTPDSPGGVIVRKPGSQEPAGVLKDTAQELVRRVIPPASEAQIREAIEAGMAQARRVGVTTIQDMSLDAASLRVFQQLLQEGKLTLRVDGRWPLERWKELAGLGLMRNFDSQYWIKVGGLKAFVDGSVGSSTARFRQPYTKNPSTRGVYVTPPAHLKKDILEADRAGLHVTVHAIGDEANSVLLDIYAEVIRENGPKDRRLRIEHAQHIDPKDFARFVEYDVIASVQPYHAIDDGRWLEKRIGYQRCKTTYAFRTFLDHGVKMSFGTDWTVAPLDPILGIDAAVTRRTTDGANPNGWFPEERVSVEEAIEAYTLTAAYAGFDENIKGSITPGKLADMVVLSQDILTIPKNDIVKTEVVCTIVDGKVVYKKD